jgi:hypothetical protein
VADLSINFKRWESERDENGNVIHGSEEDWHGINGRMCPSCQAEQDRKLALFWALYEQIHGPPTVRGYEPNRDRPSYPGYPVKFAHGGKRSDPQRQDQEQDPPNHTGPRVPGRQRGAQGRIEGKTRKRRRRRGRKHG